MFVAPIPSSAAASSDRVLALVLLVEVAAGALLLGVAVVVEVAAAAQLLQLAEVGLVVAALELDLVSRPRAGVDPHPACAPPSLGEPGTATPTGSG